MPLPSTRPEIGAMRERWREFACRDAMFHIATERRAWQPWDFYESGRTIVKDVLDWAGDGLGREQMLEIGCGVGRLLVHFADHFQRVDGVDIAPEMIEQARAAGMPDNVRVSTVSGSDLAAFADDGYDLVVSFLVFQHIPYVHVIAAYLHEAARVLKPGGRAVLQFDTRPYRLQERLAYALPDRLLPRTRRRFIRRYRLPSGEPGRLAEAAGLEKIAERDPGTALHLVLLGKPLAGAGIISS